MIIDFHVHAFPDFLAELAINEVQNRAGFKVCFNGTISGLRTAMQANGVTYSVVQPIATKPTQVQAINKWSVEICAQPGMKAFGTLHPDMREEEITAEIKFLQAHNIRGVKMHPEYQDFYADEDRLGPFYRELEKKQMILLLHAGPDLGFTGPIKAMPERLLRVHQSFPNLCLVAAHLGGYQIWDEVEKYLVGKPIYLDTAYCLHEPADAQMMEMIKAHGTQRVLFASDAPWGNQALHVRNFEKMSLTPQEMQDIAWKNAYNLLRMHPEPPGTADLTDRLG